jgi:hypothetical protein
MTMTQEIERLRRKAAELIEQAARRDRPLSRAEDGEILALLEQARELEARGRHDKKTHHPTN